MDEVGGLRKHYDEAAFSALIGKPKIGNRVKWIKGKKEVKAVYGDKNEIDRRLCNLRVVFHSHWQGIPLCMKGVKLHRKVGRDEGSSQHS
jgi:hypothetical protein